MVLLTDNIIKLQHDIIRWTEEVSSQEARGTLLQGIAGKAVNGFENVLRESLGYYLSLSGLPYESALAPDFTGKSLDMLTLGQVVQSFNKLDRKFVRCLRSRATIVGRFTGAKRLIGKMRKEQLDEITKLRNLLNHYPEKFTKDESTLMSNTTQLLSLIQQQLSGPLFQTLLSGGL